MLAKPERLLLEQDAGLLARLWASDPRLDVLHGLFELHVDLARFRATVDRPLAELRGDEVAEPGLLAALRDLDGAELVHASLAAQLDGFAPLLDAMLGELEPAVDRVWPWLERVCERVPELSEIQVELVFALGLHGRALPRRILVGSPTGWNVLAPARVAVLAGHEALVQASGRSGYVESERWALAELTRRMRSADAELRAAHADWLDSLDLSGLA